MDQTITRLREYSGSLRALARKAEVSISTVSGIRTGTISNPGIRTVQAIEKALNELEPVAAGVESAR